ncbi:MAG: AfsR/SARP family transcriptional regulator [Microthrixaceae bacterium]
MQIGVLGPLEVLGDHGEQLRVGSPTQRRLLTVLASRPGHVFSSDVLIDALWGASPPDSATRSLRTYVSRLRTKLAQGTEDDVIETVSNGYRLTLAIEAVDVCRFDAAVEAAVAPDESALDGLADALALWRGSALADAAGAEITDGEARRLEELRGTAREKLATALLEAGRPDEAAARCEALTTDEPFREGAWTLLVRSLTASGRTAEALRAFQRASEHLADAGLEPSSTLRAAEAAALEGPAASPETPQIESPQLVRTRQQGPPQSTVGPPTTGALIGREQDLATAMEMLGRSRVVTVLGPGGVGKTRLASEVARRVEPDRADGCRFVALAAVAPGTDVAASIVDALGLSVDSDDVDEVLGAAAPLDALVVLDNCEHVLDDVAAAVERMLSPGGSIRVLATSRERLGVEGEHALALRPLSTSGDDPQAMALFLERANAAAPEVAMSLDAMNDTEVTLLGEIVRRLDGLPLAIEMAAARLASIGPRDLLDLLEDHLTLRSSRRRVEPRHRTMGAVIEWSTSLLDEDERNALATMAVFSTPVGLDDIEAVTDRRTAVELVPSLAERSLLVLERSAGAMRYGMLDTVRRHVQAASDAPNRNTAARHATHFADRLAAIDAAMRTTEESSAVRDLGFCYGELSTSIRWAISNEPPMACAMFRNLHLAARNQFRDQPLSWAQESLDLLNGDEPGFGDVLSCVAERHVNQGDLESAEELVTRAAELEPVSPLTLELLADVHGYRGQHDEALKASRRHMELANEQGDEHARGMATLNIVLTHLYSGNTAMAREELQEIPDATEAGPSVRGWAEYITGEVALVDDPEASAAHLRRAIEAGDSVDNRFLGGVARVSVASLLAHTGDAGSAIQAFASIVDYWRRQGARTHMETTLRHLVILLTRIHEFDAAASLLGVVKPSAQRPSSGAEARRLGEAESELVSALGADRFSELIETGGRQSVDQASGAALSVLSELRT